MEKLLTKKKANKISRNEKIKADYIELKAVGSMNQAIYEELARRYKVSISTALRLLK